MSQRIDFYSAAPGAMKALGGVYSYLSQTGLSHSLLELVFLRVSQINGCAYCIDMHTQALHKAEMPWHKIVLTQVWHESGALFDAREQAALAWAESLTLIASQGAPQALFEQVKAVFSDKEIVDLNVAIGLMNTYNRLAISLKKLPDSAPRD
ncbi:carboxymuconolactone decarboxylase family protein [Pantoea sp. At-9b]|uniref:carboxymuconolactone decarboxylase family protein n=1 Tax=Pantoea sp. (strain At-9b) TaxID=592316 RepID=UPI0001B40B39|nr:carboxymuconolactone decarboxylase family protein [Pantoea sp. At-9b]ADU71114.1 alkylhydroperoxidase like protein, AhpD family [Pantoea sp. At-9b]